MTYPMKVEQSHVLKYGTNVRLVAQQLQDPLQQAVTIVPASGEAQSVADLVGKVRAERGESRSRRNPENPVRTSRRWVVRPEAIESGQYIDKEDKFDSATDPTSIFVQAHTAAVTRGYGDALLGVDEVENGVYEVAYGGILGMARQGKTPGSGTPLPASQYIPHGGTGYTLPKLRDAVKTLKLADFGIDRNLDPLFGLISPHQEDNLLAIAAEAGPSLNSYTIDQLKNGKPTMLMGVTWIVTNRLPYNAAGKRLCPIWSKANVVGGEWQAIQGTMWNDTSAKNLPYCYISAYIDAVRAEDKGVIVIEANE